MRQVVRGRRPKELPTVVLWRAQGIVAEVTSTALEALHHEKRGSELLLSDLSKQIGSVETEGFSVVKQGAERDQLSVAGTLNFR
jgi:hypothetical protein